MTGVFSAAQQRAALADTLVAQARAHLQMGDLAEARALVARHGHCFPQTAAASLLQGLLALAEGDGAQALECLTSAHKILPGIADICLPLAHLYSLSGQPEAAEGVLYTALAQNPECAPLYYQLARLAVRRNAWEVAAEAVAKACHYAPEMAEAWNLSGVIWRRLQRFPQAEAAFRRCLQQAPQTTAALLNLAGLMGECGDWSQSAHWAKQALAIEGQSLQAWGLLADAQRGLSEFQIACASYDRILSEDPTALLAWNGKGLALTALGRHHQAVECFQAAAALAPDNADICANVAMAAAQASQWDLVETFAARALALVPDHLVALNAQGWRLLGQDQFLAARDSFARVLAKDPDNVAAIASMAYVLRRAGLLQECLDVCLGAIERGATSGDVLMNCGVALLELRRVPEALQVFIAALDDPRANHPEILSNLCMASHYDPDCGLEERADLHRRYGALVASTTQAPPLPVGNSRDGQRMLRVGYLSGDLRQHSVAYFLAPILEAHDRAEVEVWLYSTHPVQDPMSQRLYAAAAMVRDVSTCDDQGLAAQIRDDQIDVLVDLSGHSSYNRLPVIALRPAPVQLTWLGYPGATGVAAFEGRLVDTISDPAVGNHEPVLEPLLRLPRCFLAYQAPANAPNPAPSPWGAGGVFTFGSFNTAHKINDLVLDAWGDILRRCPESRLFLKAKQYADASARQDLISAFARRGIEPQRLDLVGFTATFHDHLNLYGRVDVALDTFPYNGTTTTCEALWMGVPTLTLCGDHHAARVGASLLSAVGLEDLFVCKDMASYCARAEALARNPQPLIALRSGVRQRLQDSPLGDTAALARSLEHTYRQLWQQWCAKQAAEIP
jgi:predicted O-linked N-acetylglucosamine transferase (SPINDLY family)